MKLIEERISEQLQNIRYQNSDINEALKEIETQLLGVIGILNVINALERQDGKADDVSYVNAMMDATAPAIYVLRRIWEALYNTTI